MPRASCRRRKSWPRRRTSSARSPRRSSCVTCRRGPRSPRRTTRRPSSPSRWTSSGPSSRPRARGSAPGLPHCPKRRQATRCRRRAASRRPKSSDGGRADQPSGARAHHPPRRRAPGGRPGHRRRAHRARAPRAGQGRRHPAPLPPPGPARGAHAHRCGGAIRPVGLARGTCPAHRRARRPGREGDRGARARPVDAGGGAAPAEAPLPGSHDLGAQGRRVRLDPAGPGHARQELRAGARRRGGGTGDPARAGVLPRPARGQRPEPPQGTAERRRGARRPGDRGRRARHRGPARHHLPDSLCQGGAARGRRPVRGPASPHAERARSGGARAGARPARARGNPRRPCPPRLPAERLRADRRGIAERVSQRRGAAPRLTDQATAGRGMTEIRRVGGLGCGLMGSGHAQDAATAGRETIVRDVAQQIWDRARGGLEKSLANFVEKGKLPAADRDAALKRLTFTTATIDLKGCDIVVEAITEDLELKNALWKELDAICPPHTIFASNTSSLTIAAMAAATKRADRFVGLHFFNPVPLMQLVEVVRAVTTSEETFRRAFAFARSLGKEAVAAKDNSGFIVNLLLVPYLLDAIRAVEHGVGTVPDIDKAMQLGCGYPMGPLTLLDFVGLDTTYRIAEIMFTEHREQKYAPPPLLKRMVTAGLMGRKCGKGFYDYSADPPRVVDLGI